MLFPCNVRMQCVHLDVDMDMILDCQTRVCVLVFLFVQLSAIQSITNDLHIESQMILVPLSFFSPSFFALLPLL